ncbi:unnamed protein product [Ceutorhynchus assimilis]|uniref:Uncharacterized protein n=1 Tax=Ceutorhynchus assimilis TaxID=467358 RepID=A0A9P0DMX6_9CUCU|nr:unnamed protein product [Ceutorhynchus assimilis]
MSDKQKLSVFKLAHLNLRSIFTGFQEFVDIVQRYFVNDEFFDENKRDVAFLFIEGQNEASDEWMTNGEWYEYAQQFNAILFEVEHRYFGKSRPTENVSVENMKYMSTEQALADLAEFVVAMNKEHNLAEDVKWIAFAGANYGAFLRLKYPHLIHGAVSSSAPMLAVVDFQDYFKNIAEVLNETDVNCLSALQAGTAQMAERLKDKAGATNLTSLFQLCTPLEEVMDNEDDISSFFSILSDNFAVVAQFNKANRLSSRNTPLANITLDTLCNIMTDVSKQEIDRLASVNSLMLNAFGETCIDYSYSTLLNDMRNETWEAALGGRQEFYQFCNEYGYFQTSTLEVGFGDIPLKWYLKQCTDIFGSQFNETFVNRAIERTNVNYGGLDIKVSNVAFVNGSKDPWRTLGITNSTDEDAPAIFIQGAAHDANMYPSTDKDLPQLTEARTKIRGLIQSWLNQ